MIMNLSRARISLAPLHSKVRGGAVAFLLLLVVFVRTGDVEAAPFFQAAGAAVGETGAVSLAWPTHQAGDVALLIVESTGGQAAALSTAAGFAEVPGSPQATGTGTNGTRITVFWARATSAAMPAPTIASPGNHAYAQIITYRDVISTGNPWDVTGGGVKAAASTAVTVSGVTTSMPDTRIVQIVARDNDSAAAAFSNQTNATLLGIAERSDAGTTSGNGGGFVVWDAIMPAAGVTGDTTATVTSSINAFLTIALKPQPFSCTPPSNIPGGVSVSCVCDTFGRSSLNPSTIFGGNWSVSNSDGLGNPYISAVTGLLRLTENTGNNAKAATVPSIFPAAGNYISVEFGHYAYNGTGADGIAVTLSDYSIPAVPGAFGGSLGYAQRTGVVGFAGGWIGVALDEYGNYQNPTEGRVDGPGFIVQSVGVRGPGSGANGYRWMGGTASNPGGLGIDNRTSTAPAPGYMFQVIVDARNYAAGTINVSVNRDAATRDGSSYTSLLGPFNAYPEASHALGQGWISKLVPDYWKISFTGSTGGSTNIHEIGRLRVCAQTILPPTGGTASGFSAIDAAYPGAPSVPAYQNFQTGNIYMKLTGVPFNLWVAALTGTGISTGYSATTAKYVQVKLVDNTDNACGPDSARTCNAACANKAGVEAGATRVATFVSGSATGVASPSPSFTLNSAYKNLIAVMKECTTSACSEFTATTPACSADSFSVRPTGFSSVAVSASASYNGTVSGTPTRKAGSDNFSLTLSSAGIAGSPSRYTGSAKIDNATLRVVAPATVAGVVAPLYFAAATSGTPSSTATGNFTYSEVGAFGLRGYNPATDSTSPRSVYDGVHLPSECSALTPAQCDLVRATSWTGIDSVSTKADCIADSYRNTADTSGTFASNSNYGKFGCNFGLLANSADIGRFTPDHFSVTGTLVTRSDLSLTRGTVAAASSSLAVTSASGIVPGNILVIWGAGPGGTPLQATVSAVAGTTVTLGTAVTTAVANGNVYNISTQSMFTYLGEPMLLLTTVTARNAAEGVTANYVGVPATGFAKLDAATLGSGANWMNTACAAGTQCFGFGAIDGAVTPLTSRLAVDTSVASPVSAWISGIGSFATHLRLIRPTTATFDPTWGPYETLNFGAVPMDADGITLPGPVAADVAHRVDLDADANTIAERRLIATTKQRFGRLRLINAYGSELLPMRVEGRVEYWNGSAWLTHIDDVMTNIPLNAMTTSGGIAANTCFLPNPPPSGPSNASCLASSPAITISAGRGSWIVFDKITPQVGYVDLTVGLAAMPWLRGWWSGAATGHTEDPIARIRFGSPKAPYIYLRERY